jgi:hypothetical protein
MNIKDLDLNEMNIVAGGSFWSKTVSVGKIVLKAAWVGGFLYMANRSLNLNRAYKHLDDNQISIKFKMKHDPLGMGYAALGMAPLAYWVGRGIFGY